MNKRFKKVEEYYERHGNQQKWYSQKATKSKKQFEWIGLAVVVLAAITGIVPMLELDGPSSISLSEKVTSFLATLIVVLKGFERIWLPEEKWRNYRRASESLKKETELYVEGVSPYDVNLDEEKSFKIYIQQCCLIKAEEQSNFWGIRREATADSNSPDVTS